MRAEPELGTVQTWLGRSREAEEEKLFFPKQMSNSCLMEPVKMQN